MSYSEHFNPADNMDYSVSSNEFKKMTDGLKKSDKGYNVIWRMLPKNDILKRTKVEVYTSSCYGCHIRDAETGDYYTHIVGSADEDLYFSVILATGECKSKNGSSTLFYLSPEHYMSHFKCELDPSVLIQWQSKRDARVKSAAATVSKRQNFSAVAVN